MTLEERIKQLEERNAELEKRLADKDSHRIHLQETPKLSMYVNDGRWHIDNNGVENAIRPLATGRKNYLFCGSDASAVRASMIYSFTASCKVAGIEPREWFEDVIRRIPEYENDRSDVTHLLPKNWKRNFNDCNDCNQR